MLHDSTEYPLPCPGKSLRLKSGQYGREGTDFGGVAKVYAFFVSRPPPPVFVNAPRR